MYTKQEDDMTENNLYPQLVPCNGLLYLWNMIKCPGASWAFSTGIEASVVLGSPWLIRRAVSLTVCPVQLVSVSEMPHELVEGTSVKGPYNERE